MRSYTVYKHTSPSGKVYIGITCQRPEIRWNGGRGYKHSPHFSAAIARHGWENFHHEILAEGLTREAAEAMEVALIAEYDSTNRTKGYNADKGGLARPRHSEETRAKISAAVSGERHPLYGAKQSPEWVEKRMRHMRGRHLTAEHANKLKYARLVAVKCLDTGEEYESATEAGRCLNIGNSKITAVCRGHRKTTHGTRWEYANK